MGLASTNGLNCADPIDLGLVERAAWWLRRLLVGAAVVVSGLPFAVSSPAGERPKPTESQVQVAYLYNFGKFVQWPANAAGTKSNLFNICVYGQDPFGATLYTTVADGIIDGKRVVAKRIVDAHEAVSCQILFISSSEDTRLKTILEDLNKAAVLTVSDMPQFSQRGGMIQFVLDGNKVRFEVDLTATQSAGLTLSSELLRVAAAVKRSPIPGG
ncbi:MAG TPA: YfiR family protein [Bryobacteraceae bacterium]|nr:YfiR family protein [Bryobacteraceae bacterium]